MDHVLERESVLSLFLVRSLGSLLSFLSES